MLRGREGRIGTEHHDGRAAEDLTARVLRALEEVRPGLRADGGDVELVGIPGGVVQVRLLGACSGCPFAQRTLVEFITERVLLHAPEVRRVESV